jgi:hypothetical protein
MDRRRTRAPLTPGHGATNAAAGTGLKEKTQKTNNNKHMNKQRCQICGHAGPTEPLCWHHFAPLAGESWLDAYVSINTRDARHNTAPSLCEKCRKQTLALVLRDISNRLVKIAEAWDKKIE